MTAGEVAAIVAPVGVVLGWLTKHLQTRNSGENGVKAHRATIERLLTNIERHTAEIPLLRQTIEQHEASTVRAREQVGELTADMKQRQRRGE